MGIAERFALGREDISVIVAEEVDSVKVMAEETPEIKAIALGVPQGIITKLRKRSLLEKLMQGYSFSFVEGVGYFVPNDCVPAEESPIDPSKLDFLNDVRADGHVVRIAYGWKDVPKEPCSSLDAEVSEGIIYTGLAMVPKLRRPLSVVPYDRDTSFER